MSPVNDLAKQPSFTYFGSKYECAPAKSRPLLKWNDSEICRLLMEYVLVASQSAELIRQLGLVRGITSGVGW
jgi:hypothetical protein